MSGSEKSRPSCIRYTSAEAACFAGIESVFDYCTAHMGDEED